MRVGVVAWAGVAVVLVACAGGPRPDFTLDFRNTYRGVLMRDMWYGLVANRYGCDTVMVKARGGRPLGAGISACEAASWVYPSVVRSWRDSTGLTEQWDYRGGACSLDLRGVAPPFLLVYRVRC